MCINGIPKNKLKLAFQIDENHSAIAPPSQITTLRNALQISSEKVWSSQYEALKPLGFQCLSQRLYALALQHFEQALEIIDTPELQVGRVLAMYPIMQDGSVITSENRDKAIAALENIHHPKVSKLIAAYNNCQVNFDDLNCISMFLY